MYREDLAVSLERNKRILSHFINTIPREKIFLHRGPGTWTIYQHVRHLAEVQEMVTGRLKLFFQDIRPPIVPYYPEKEIETMTDTSKPLSELLEFYSLWRDRQLEIIGSATSEIWNREIEHPEYQLYTFEILVRHIFNHDGFHMYRIEELWLLHDRGLPRL